MSDLLTTAFTPLMLLVLIPSAHLWSEGAHGAGRAWRIASTILAVLAGLALAALGGGVGTSLLSIAGLLAYSAVWKLAPPDLRVRRRMRMDAGEVEVAGSVPARVVTRREQGGERLIEFMSEMPAETLRLRIASEPWFGRQHPDPSMSVLDVRGWNQQIVANDVRWALTLLTPVFRSIVDRCDAIHRGSFLLELRPGVMTVRALVAPDEEHRLEDWTNDCYALADHLRDALRTGVPMRRGAVMTPVDPEGIEVVAVEARPAAKCNICGCVIDEAPVRCASCGTAHHADCWEYNGCCSVYACGGCQLVER